MASGDAAELKSIGNPLVASSASAGTYCWCITKGGRIVRYTLAGGAIQSTAGFTKNVRCIYSDNTYIYFGMSDGRLLRYTTATKVNSELKRFRAAITSMTVSGGKIYVTLSNGKLYSYEI